MLLRDDDVPFCRRTQSFAGSGSGCSGNLQVYAQRSTILLRAGRSKQQALLSASLRRCTLVSVIDETACSCKSCRPWRVSEMELELRPSSVEQSSAFLSPGQARCKSCKSGMASCTIAPPSSLPFSLLLLTLPTASGANDTGERPRESGRVHQSMTTAAACLHEPRVPETCKTRLPATLIDSSDDMAQAEDLGAQMKVRPRRSRVPDSRGDLLQYKPSPPAGLSGHAQLTRSPSKSWH